MGTMENNAPVHCVSMDLLRRLEIFKDRSDSELTTVKGFHIFPTPARDCSGGFGYLVLTNDDEVFGFGHNCENINILGFPRDDPNYRHETVQKPSRIETLSGRGLRDISIGGLIGAAVAGCGTLLWWGVCHKDDVMCPRSPVEAAARRTKFLRVSCGYQFMAALTEAHCVQVWGRVVQDDLRFFRGERLDIGVQIAEVSCGLHHLAMRDEEGYVYTWGRGEEGQRGLVEYAPNQTYVARKVMQEPCSLVKCGPSSTYCLTKQFQEVYACGSSSDCRSTATPARFKTLIHSPITDLAIVKQPNSHELVAACTSDSEIYTWGSSRPHPVLTDTSSMIEVFALWNITPGLTRINCLPSLDTPIYDKYTRTIMDDVLNYIYLKDRPDLALEADIFLYSCPRSNLRYYARLLSDKEKTGSFILQKFLADLTSKNQIPPQDRVDFQYLEIPSQKITTQIRFRNWTIKPTSQSNFRQSTSNTLVRPTTSSSMHRGTTS